MTTTSLGPDRSRGCARATKNLQRLRASFACPRCLRAFRTTSNLSRHYRLECVDLPRFKCPHCEMRSKYTQAIYRHIRVKHRGMELTFVKLY